MLNLLFMSGVVSKIKDWLSRTLGGYGREFLAMYRAWMYLERVHSRKFMIYGRGRSGSTLLTDLLNQSDQIYCDKEIFNRRVFWPKFFLRNRSAVFGNPIYGFKLLSYQLKDFIQPDDPNEFLTYLVRKRGYKIIFIGRENLIRQTISKHYAEFRQSWHDKGDSSDRPKFKVDIKRLLLDLKAGKLLDDYEEASLKGLPYMEVVYELDLKDSSKHEKLIDRLIEYIKADHFEAEARLRRISSDKLEDIVENYDEMITVLKESPYANYLEEEEIS